MVDSTSTFPDLVDLLRPLITHDGFSETSIPQVSLIATHRPVERTPLMYDPSLIIVAQGQKVGYLGEREIHYNPGHYLVQTLPLPFECETFASPDAPLLAMSVHIDPAMLGELVMAAGSPPFETYEHEPLPMDSVALTPGISEAVIRLVRALHDPVDASVMGQARVRDVIFEALKGEQGPALRALIQNQGNYSRIVQVLSQMHADFDHELSVDTLAHEANMSVSSFHHHFKRITHASPLQYLKRLRLLKARLLLSHDDLNINRIAERIGYRSVSQFSRDYKRYFGVSPMKDRQQSPGPTIDRTTTQRAS
ncbi:AraC family transcriptional regulator [Aidingimonas halophila]|uniref:Transcriptional regulator, AraC family n=1 Tax=Aidingimonas halophila TaxID=574349 RepID=A0A1H2UVY5_9GAMM|nr:AraC family transcriptional regulator [Aidingimonas halophila]GHC23284.1 AraC family transcriptional regulator [Aidingimonas halophila]SDW60287.1 transcriptional regulator, AraC family [Aidingimonas halophila]